jgi:hypothetical protein
MGRADIAIYSTISGGIRLCLHPPHFPSVGGSAYDGLRLVRSGRTVSFVCPAMSEHGGPRGGSGHLIGRMIMRASVVTGSYGLIVLLPVGQKPRPTLTGLRYRWTARLGRARASAILSDSECCREMSFISNLSVFVLPWIEEVPFGANFVLGCSSFFPI